MATGGVKPTKESLEEWFDAGVTCVGMGSKLFKKDLIEKKKFAELTMHIKNVLKLIKEAKN